CRFCFYFPEKEKYEGRFFQYLSPAPEDEHESEHLTGEDDKISFVLTHGGYYVVSNQGGFLMGTDSTRLYKTSASTAEFGRVVAQRIYGFTHRPFGYVFGGSGGSFKTISCMEMTEGVWDGGVPYVVANPMATPNVFAPRVRAMRVLGEEGIARVIDNMEPGGSGDFLEGLNEEQREILSETTRMGFPKRGWFTAPTMGDGSLMVLVPYLYQVYPQYFEDFWTKEGFEGANPDSSEAKARVRFETTVSELIQPKRKEAEEYTSVDNSWVNTMIGNNDTPRIRMKEIPQENAYLFHCRIRVLSGKAAGRECAVDTIENGVITVSSAFDGSNMTDAFPGLAVGDKILIDNSDYLAMQTFQRHQIPDETYHVYDQYRNEDGTLKYPQLPMLLAPMIAMSGGGSVPTGDIHGKVITLCSILDESAFAWHGDWYREAVRRHLGSETDRKFRLYYQDNCLHNDVAGFLADPQHEVDYVGMLHQALLDLAAWCEQGIEPVPDTNYQVVDGQVEVPENAHERGGLQPVVHALAENERCVRVKVGEPVHFTARIDAPAGAGEITAAAWDYERTNDFSHEENLELSEDGRSAMVRTEHIFTKKGVYFPVIKVKSNRNGKQDIYTQCKNLDRVRVIVEE
ncbi:MAG: hypothetical protein Q4B26_01875, partial [Eubacteriales bacterium]|nr:hypothetical protein [Eubacteriales bacterium]